MLEKGTLKKVYFENKKIKEFLQGDRAQETEIEFLREIWEQAGIGGNSVFFHFSDDFPLCGVKDVSIYEDNSFIIRSHLISDSNVRRLAEIAEEEGMTLALQKNQSSKTYFLVAYFEAPRIENSPDL